MDVVERTYDCKEITPTFGSAYDLVRDEAYATDMPYRQLTDFVIYSRKDKEIMNLEQPARKGTVELVQRGIVVGFLEKDGMPRVRVRIEFRACCVDRVVDDSMLAGLWVCTNLAWYKLKKPCEEYDPFFKSIRKRVVVLLRTLQALNEKGDQTIDDLVASTPALVNLRQKVEENPKLFIVNVHDCPFKLFLQSVKEASKRPHRTVQMGTLESKPPSMNTTQEIGESGQSESKSNSSGEITVPANDVNNSAAKRSNDKSDAKKSRAKTAAATPKQPQRKQAKLAEPEATHTVAVPAPKDQTKSAKSQSKSATSREKSASPSAKKKAKASEKEALAAISTNGDTVNAAAQPPLEKRPSDEAARPAAAKQTSKGGSKPQPITIPASSSSASSSSSSSAVTATTAGNSTARARTPTASPGGFLGGLGRRQTAVPKKSAQLGPDYIYHRQQKQAERQKELDGRQLQNPHFHHLVAVGVTGQPSVKNATKSIRWRDTVVAQDIADIYPFIREPHEWIEQFPAVAEFSMAASFADQRRAENLIERSRREMAKQNSPDADTSEESLEENERLVLDLKPPMYATMYLPPPPQPPQLQSSPEQQNRKRESGRMYFPPHKKPAVKPEMPTMAFPPMPHMLGHTFPAAMQFPSDRLALPAPASSANSDLESCPF